MNLIDIVNEKLKEILMGKIPDKISLENFSDEREKELFNNINNFISSISEIHQFVQPLSKGELNEISINRWNLMGAPFKELHSRLLNLTWQAGQIADGDYSQRIDFMGDFSRSFNAMVKALDLKDRALKTKIEELEKNKRLIENELDIARTIQDNLIPSVMPDFQGASFYSIYRPVVQVGGDLFDFITFHERNKIGVFISDVSGHGVPAALITSMVKTLSTSAGLKRESPSGFLQFINNGLVGLTGDNFLTAFYGIYDSSAGTLTYSRCGHCYPLLLRNCEISPVKSSGTIMGIAKDINIEEKVINLCKGDKIIFYTDGLTEATNSGNVQFEDYMLDRILPEIAGLDIEKLLNRLYESLIVFTKNNPPDDDICIVGMEVH
jgi:serine phosphatase RsbU (regulator of sigma subunit)